MQQEAKLSYDDQVHVLELSGAGTHHASNTLKVLAGLGTEGKNPGNNANSTFQRR